MALPFPIDLRDRIVTAGEAGLSRRALAKRFVASHSAAIKIVRRARETGRVALVKTGDYRKPKLSEHDELLHAAIAQKPDRTLPDRCKASGGPGRTRTCNQTVMSGRL